ncbi:MAG: hypothetical protein WBB26_12675 [Saprospiraceae bacterium]
MRHVINFLLIVLLFSIQLDAQIKLNTSKVIDEASLDEANYNKIVYESQSIVTKYFAYASLKPSVENSVGEFIGLFSSEAKVFQDYSWPIQKTLVGAFDYIEPVELFGENGIVFEVLTPSLQNIYREGDYIKVKISFDKRVKSFVNTSKRELVSRNPLRYNLSLKIAFPNYDLSSGKIESVEATNIKSVESVENNEDISNEWKSRISYRNDNIELGIEQREVDSLRNFLAQFMYQYDKLGRFKSAQEKLAFEKLFDSDAKVVTEFIIDEVEPKDLRAFGNEAYNTIDEGGLIFALQNIRLSSLKRNVEEEGYDAIVEFDKNLFKYRSTKESRLVSDVKGVKQEMKMYLVFNGNNLDKPLIKKLELNYSNCIPDERKSLLSIGFGVRKNFSGSGSLLLTDKLPVKFDENSSLPSVVFNMEWRSNSFYDIKKCNKKWYYIVGIQAEYSSRSYKFDTVSYSLSKTQNLLQSNSKDIEYNRTVSIEKNLTENVKALNLGLNLGMSLNLYERRQKMSFFLDLVVIPEYNLLYSSLANGKVNYDVLIGSQNVKSLYKVTGGELSNDELSNQSSPGNKAYINNVYDIGQRDINREFGETKKSLGNQLGLKLLLAPNFYFFNSRSNIAFFISPQVYFRILSEYKSKSSINNLFDYSHDSPLSNEIAYKKYDYRGIVNTVNNTTSPISIGLKFGFAFKFQK